MVGPTLKKVAHVVPTGRTMEPVNAMLASGVGAREIAPFALAFAAMFALTFWLATRRLQVS